MSANINSDVIDDSFRLDSSPVDDHPIGFNN